MTIKDICKKYYLRQADLCRLFDIPVRTVHEWYHERRMPPEYLVKMMDEVLSYRTGAENSVDAPDEDLSSAERNAILTAVITIVEMSGDREEAIEHIRKMMTK